MRIDKRGVFSSHLKKLYTLFRRMFGDMPEALNIDKK
jgi:hypothetical protein